MTMAAHSDPYNSLTRRNFANPAHAGDLGGEYTVCASAVASESADGAIIQLAAGVRDGRLQECRFRAYGCPHLIAAAEWLCGNIEGGLVSELARIHVDDCMQALAVPISKTGRILLLEDAIRLLGEQIDSD